MRKAIWMVVFGVFLLTMSLLMAKRLFFPMTQTEISSFTYGHKLLRIWGLTNNKPDTPFSLWNFRYDPLFIPDINEKDEVIETIKHGLVWHTQFVIALDDDRARNSAYEKVVQTYSNNTGFDPENIFALHVSYVELRIPGLFDQVEGAGFSNPGSVPCQRDTLCLKFFSPVNKFRVVISTKDKETALKVEELLKNSQVVYEARLQAGVIVDKFNFLDPVVGHIELNEKYIPGLRQLKEGNIFSNRIEQLELFILLKQQREEYTTLVEKLRSDMLQQSIDMQKFCASTVSNSTKKLEHDISDILDIFRSNGDHIEKTVEIEEDEEPCGKYLFEKIAVTEEEEVEPLDELFEGQCPSGWRSYNASQGIKCFLIGNTSMTYEKNVKFCHKRNASLIEIRNDDENSFVSDYLADLGEHVVILAAKQNENNDFTWPNGELTTYQKWGQNEPNNHGGNERCVQLRSSKSGSYWNDFHCGTDRAGQVLYYPGCQRTITESESLKSESRDHNVEYNPKPASSEKTAVLEEEGSGEIASFEKVAINEEVEPLEELFEGECPSGWRSYSESQGIKCFLIGNTSMTYEENVKFCHKRSASLIVIRNDDENNFVSEYLSDLGGEVVTLAAKINENNDFAWPNGELLTYKKWGRGEPNNSDGNERCVQLRSSKFGSSWNDFDCEKNRAWDALYYPGCQRTITDIRLK